MGASVRFRGGSLDGLALRLPAVATTVVTTEREGGRSYYVIDDTAGTAWFTGFNEQGGEMAGIIRQFSASATAGREAIEAAMRPKGCPPCGRTFGTRSAYEIHFEQGPGSRCLPGDAYGQLVEVDGVWCVPGSEAAW
jgi:hypothetical protein